MLIKTFHISIAQKIIENYDGKTPFKNYLNNLFKENKNWGSKDRKIYRDLCYKYFRLGSWVNDKNLTDILYKITQDYESLKSEINENEYLAFVKQISSKIECDKLKKLYQTPKKVYVKSIQKHQNKIIEFLKTNNINFILNERVFIFEKDENLDKIIEQGWGIIMDLSSQKSIDLWKLKGNENLLDICTGAGGKTIFLKNKFPNLNIINFDVRESILKNFSNRYINIFNSFPNFKKVDMILKNDFNQKFDAILADVPCSGSGTWGRTPENILFFKEDKILEYQKIQQSILTNAVEMLKPLGKFCYITCSVFSKENEENTEFLVKNLGLELLNETYVNADFPYSDILYLAEFVKC